MTREERAQELREFSKESPQRVIALYRDATGQDELSQLPPSVSFTSMIDTILKHEEATGQLHNELPHAAGAA